MPRILVLFGSPHESGLTASLLHAFLEKAPAGFKTDIAAAYAQTAEPCDGCLACGKTPGCVKNREEDVFSRLESADFLVVATPVYLLSFPAPLKAVFDRFEQYYAARFLLGKKPAIKKPKKAFLIITQGSVKGRGPEIIFEQAKTAFSVMNTVITGSYVFSGADTAREAERETAYKEIGLRAQTFFEHSRQPEN